MPKNSNNQSNFDKVITALLNNNAPFPPVYLHQFSDIEGQNLENLKKVWSQINPDRRSNLMIDLEELSINDTLVNFDNLASFALADKDARVRKGALDLLWDSGNPRLIPIMVNLLDRDADESVRAAAAQTLGQFVLLGELEEIKPEMAEMAEEGLLRVSPKDPLLVRLRALESLGYSSREEVAGMIKSAFNAIDPKWISSALFAMGRSADIQWEPNILNSLNHPVKEVQMEAVRAAGQLELQSARSTLLSMLVNAEEVDDEVYAAAIWSLSQIGGESVREALEAIAESTDDEDAIEFIESALENLEFTTNYGELNLLDVKFDEKSDLTSTFTLEENKEEFEDDEDSDFDLDLKRN